MATRLNDLHTHTTHSDGTTTPHETLAMAQDAGISVIALTDHDTSSGWMEAVETVPSQKRPLILSGMEMSVSNEGKPLHLLVYGFDPENAALLEFMSGYSPEERARQFVDNLSADYDISFEEVANVSGTTNINRPHIARVLFMKGITSTFEEGFRTLLHSTSPYYVEKTSPALLAALPVVRAAGGVPVIAHGYSTALRDERSFCPDQLPLLKEAGLLGLEIYHREHQEDEINELLMLTREYGLIPTGGSDFHGENKPNMLGENSTFSLRLERILEASGIDHLF